MDEIKDRLTASQVLRVCQVVKKSCEDLYLSDAIIYVLLNDIIYETRVVSKKSWTVENPEKTESYV